jgi:CPA2 family monovalent cation:H+ antiporter-2
LSEVPLLVTIAVSLAYALAGGLVARRLGLPTIVGYLAAGVAVGPFTPGFVGDPHAIGQLAEIGVILLMFGIGLQFTLRDLWQVRDIAIPGSLGQMVVVTTLGFLLARSWGFTIGAASVFGFAMSVASTVVAMRALMDRGWLDTIHGRVAVGWLVFEDLVTVAVLVLLPAVTTGSAGGAGLTALWAIGKALLFVALMIVAGSRLMPAILSRVVSTQSRELFVLAALTAAVGVALASASVFGVSLPLAAFVAGLVISESPFSHQVGADLLPFREAFAVLFFVSVGTLVNPTDLVSDWGAVALLSAFTVIGKPMVAALISWALPYPARTALVVAAGRGQIGEFSFIIGQAALGLGVLDERQYSLLLAGAIVSILLSPILVRLVDPAERFLRRWPALWRVLDRQKPDTAVRPETMTGHVVIVGCGRVGRHIAEALGRLEIPRLVIEVDPARLAKLRSLGVPVLYGDAGSTEILDHVALEHARALIVTLANDATTLIVVTAARARAPDLPIVARASTWDGARRIVQAGADNVVRPELEGGVEIVRRTLLELHLPIGEVQRYSNLVRREGLDEFERPSSERLRVLDDLLHAARTLELEWLVVAEGSPVAGRTLADSGLRAAAGASVVAIGRQDAIHSNPGPTEVIEVGDRIAVIGTPDQVARAARFFEPVKRA